jgi:hypothetical protein
VSFAAIILSVASQRVFIVVVVADFVIDSVRKLSDTSSYFLLFRTIYVLLPHPSRL